MWCDIKINKNKTIATKRAKIAGYIKYLLKSHNNYSFDYFKYFKIIIIFEGVFTYFYSYVHK